jgi:hypothetical protein
MVGLIDDDQVGRRDLASREGLHAGHLHRPVREWLAPGHDDAGRDLMLGQPLHALVDELLPVRQEQHAPAARHGAVDDGGCDGGLA